MGKHVVSSSLEEGDASDEHVEKKLKLFGFEVEYYPGPDDQKRKQLRSSEGEEGVNSWSVIEKMKDSKKLECEYCLREFVNSQALGGHQNAHKRERLKKKRMQQLQARINYNLQPDIYYYKHHHAVESSISFGRQLQYCHDDEDDDDDDDVKYMQLSFKDSCTFTLTRSSSGRSGKHRPFAIKLASPAAAVDFKQNSYGPTNLDLHLSLSSNSII